MLSLSIHLLNSLVPFLVQKPFYICHIIALAGPLRSLFSLGRAGGSKKICVIRHFRDKSQNLNRMCLSHIARGLAVTRRCSPRRTEGQDSEVLPEDTDTRGADWWHVKPSIHHCLWVLKGRFGEGCSIFSHWWTQGQAKKYICTETSLEVKGQGLLYYTSSSSALEQV